MLKIKSTVYPDSPLSENEWMETFKVSSQVPRYDGVDRAKAIMRQWEEDRVSTTIWREMADRIKVASQEISSYLQ